MSISSSSRNSINEGESENLDYSVYSSSSDLELDIKTRDLAHCAAQQWKLQDLKGRPNPMLMLLNFLDKPVYQPDSLSTIAAKRVAAIFPFEAVENSGYTVPEELQKLIAFHSFPTDEYPIWLYSNLSCGGCSQFFRGEQLWAVDSVKNCVQVGFHLNATVTSKVDSYVNPSMMHNTDQKSENLDYLVHHVAITFDRKRITSCSCTCITDLEESGNARCPLANVSSRKPTSARVFYDRICSFRNSDSLMNFPVIDLGSFAAGFASLGPVKESRLLKRNIWAMRAKMHNSLDGVAKDEFVIDPMMCDGIWCAHIVATCLARIREPEQCEVRAPISESLSKLSKEDLQKFAQYLIVRMGPKRVLPAAQKIIDDLLSPQENSIKTLQGAPDPTAGGSLTDIAAWCFDGEILREKILITLQKFCTAKMDICEDVGMLAYSLPAEVEYHRVLLRSLRDKTPRGIWDLLQMITDMLVRGDTNALPLLEIVPEIVLPWYLVQHNASFLLGSASQNSLFTQKFASSFLCEQLIKLWRLLALNPDLQSISTHEAEECRSRLSNPESSALTNLKPTQHSSLKCQLIRNLEFFHRKVLSEATLALQKSMSTSNTTPGNANRHSNTVNWRGSRSSQPINRTYSGQKLVTALATAYRQHSKPPKQLLYQLCNPNSIEELCSPLSQDLIPGFEEAIRLLRMDLPRQAIPAKFSDPDQYRACLPIFNGVWVVSTPNLETEAFIDSFFEGFRALEMSTNDHHVTGQRRRAFRLFAVDRTDSGSENEVGFMINLP
ncbi:Zinc finger SWIM domain-containing protein 8 [Cichlidogyrus casuarinus]|uniref:Zinc finger SWIM domain-containing protein 8 n=1 Tax=Cichlidogyrus casuarinus TaxID=1844966 RepID=A0ABD2QDU7_9PLAT